MESSLAFAPDFSKSGGLIAAVAQDAETLDVLMLAWMNPEAWKRPSKRRSPLLQPQPQVPVA